MLFPNPLEPRAMRLVGYEISSIKDEYKYDLVDKLCEQK